MKYLEVNSPDDYNLLSNHTAKKQQTYVFMYLKKQI